ncbi:Hypothetical_protein [Hexamita inflata]|uniref:Hypothetical_protein n=1 Tax=Hexamita inflata TaxID=28002 RepID=A0ABP1KHJ7_9EUKA
MIVQYKVILKQKFSSKTATGTLLYTEIPSVTQKHQTVHVQNSEGKESRKSNQYKVAFTVINESSFNCLFIDQYYVPLSRKMVLHTESASTLVETSNPSHLQIIQRIYPVKLENDNQMNISSKFPKY